MNDQEKQEAEALGWRQEYIHGNGVDDNVWIHPTNGEAYLTLPPALKNPRSQKAATPRPRDRVTDNRDTFRRKLARLHDLGRVTPSHITEPDTDARIIA